MSIYFLMIAWPITAFFLIAAVMGCGRLTVALLNRRWVQVRPLFMASLRLGLMAAGFTVLLVSGERGLRMAQVLVLLSLATRLPEDLRRLRG